MNEAEIAGQRAKSAEARRSQLRPVVTLKVESVEFPDDEGPGVESGPLIVWDPVRNDLVWESPDWMTRHEAQLLADERGWVVDIT